ncbi:hypothetical protein AB0467_28655 [Streptomyces sp. NPDC052095]|uniref:hypothetical protein n=1 Tax=Streptomyces sp. NPDC052095 TaxID=3155678 RepID=UPI00344CC92B
MPTHRSQLGSGLPEVGAGHLHGPLSIQEPTERPGHLLAHVAAVSHTDRLLLLQVLEGAGRLLQGLGRRSVRVTSFSTVLYK